jgi:hypothetical protein
MRAASLLGCAIALGLAIPSAARADDSPSAPSEPTADHRLALTFSIFPLFVDTYEVTGEVAPSRRVSFALRCAAASIPGTQTVRAPIPSWTYRALGAQSRYYLFGSFQNGLPIGLEVAYGHGSTDGATANYADNDHPTGLSTGAFAGYHLVTRVGFTLDLYAGARYIAVKPKMRDASGYRLVPVDENTVVPIIDLALGWAF